MQAERKTMIDNDNGTVTDESIGLMWQQETPGKPMDWRPSSEHCKYLRLAGYTDWRLPTIKELMSLVDYNRYTPAIDITYFPNTVPSFYWSATELAYGMGTIWGVNFGYGESYGHDNYTSYYVRAVRTFYRVVTRAKIRAINTVLKEFF
jgi:hypothetical protein